MSSTYSEKELDTKAKDTLDWMYRVATGKKIVDIICKNYNYHETLSARRLAILPRRLAREDKSRIHFEFLCYAAFTAYVYAPAFIVKRPHPGGEKDEPDVPACYTFVDCLAGHFMDLAEQKGWLKLRELEATISRGEDGSLELKAVLWKHLNPVDRLNEYSRIEADGHGGSALQFVKRMAKSLDAAHYAILELLVADLNLVEIACHLGHLSMKHSFGKP